MSRRTPTSIKVTTLDLSAFEAEALEYVRAHAQVDIDRGKDVKLPESVRFGERYGVVEVGEHLYALCTEGVGPDKPVTDENPLEISVFISRHEGDGERRMIPMFPAATLKLTATQLREAKTEQEIPLDEYIRTFGARLDGNYESWRRLLETAATLAA